MKVLAKHVQWGLLLLMLGGMAYVAIPHMQAWYWREQGMRQNSHILQQTSVGTDGRPVRLGTPKELSLPRLGINLEVESGYYNQADQSWRLDGQHAFFIPPGTAPLNANASPLIYGHNRQVVFSKLDGVAADELLIIHNDAGQLLLFRYSGDTIVPPAAGQALNTTQGQSGLTLLTCTSGDFKNRRLLHFEYIGTKAAV